MARKRLNKNLVGALTLLTYVVIIVLSAVILNRLRQADPKYFIELAQRYEDEKEWKQAGLFYFKAWERSADANHLVSYGGVMLEDGNVRAALESWRRALVEDPRLASAHRKQLEVLLELARLNGRVRNWSAVQEAAEKFLGIKSPEEPEEAVAPAQWEAFAHYANGLALVNLAAQAEDNVEAGVGELQNAVTLAPGIAEYAVELATHFVRVGRTEEGEKLFRTLVEQYTTPGAEATTVRQAYATYLAGPDKQLFDEADQVFQEAATLAASDPSALTEANLGYASFLSRQWARARRDHAPESAAEELFQRAEALLKGCIELEPTGLDPYVQLATLYAAAGRHADVVEVCDQRLGMAVSRKGLAAARNRFSRFNLLISASQACVAQGAAAGIAEDHPAKEEWLARAEGYVADARGEFPTHPKAVSQAGRVKLARGQERPALEELREAQAAYRSLGSIDWQNTILLAGLHLQLGEPGAAEDVLKEVAAHARSRRRNYVAFWLLYGQALFQNDKLDAALAMSQHVLLINPDDHDAKQLKAAVYERKGRLADAGALHEEITGSGAVNAILQFREYVRDGETDKGLEVLRNALEQDPADVRLVWATVGALLRMDRTDEAGDVVERALELKPDDGALRRLAVVSRRNLSDDERDEALLQIIEAQEDDYQRSLELADFYARRKEPGKALEQIDRAEQHLILQDTPLSRKATTAKHRELLTRKLRIAAQLKNEEALQAARDSAAEHNVDGAGGKSLLGLYHMLRDETDPAIRALREAVETQPTDALSLALLGHCLLSVGRTDDAQAYLERAVRINPRLALAYRGLAAVARLDDDQEAYESAFAKCRRVAPNDSWVQAELMVRQEKAEPAAAIARRQVLLKDKPDDADNLRRLAALCEQVEDRAGADAYHTRLLELLGDDKGVVVAAGRYYRRTGRPERALEVLTSYARSKATPHERANAQILVAGHHLAVGDLEQTEAALLAAVDQAETLEALRSLGEFYIRSIDRPDEALRWFDKAAQRARDGESPQAPQILAARIACLLHRRINDLKTARGYVDELRRVYPDDLRGLYWDSEVRARTGDIEGAVAALAEYLRRSPNDAHILYQRARHLLALGRTALAIADLERIKRTNPLRGGDKPLRGSDKPPRGSDIEEQDLDPRLLLAALHARAGRDEAAIRELEALVASAPESARAVEELARAYLGAKRIPDAERLVTAQINRALAADDRGEPADPRWFWLRAQAAVESGDHSKALADARRAAEISEFSPDSLRKVLDLYAGTGRFLEGITYYEQRASSAKTTPALLSRYAFLLARADRPVEAVEAFRKAMRLAVREPVRAVWAVVEDLTNAIPVEEAIKLFESSPPSDAGAARANNRILIRLLRRSGRFGSATVRLAQAIETAPDDAERASLYFEQGEMYQMAGDPDRARAAYESSIKYDEDNWITLNNLAYLLSDALGEYGLALPYARRAVTIADTPDTLDTLGWIYVGLENYPLAIAELSRAARLDASRVLPLLHLGEAYRRSGHFLEAADVLRRALETAGAADDEATVARIEALLDRVKVRDST